MKTIRISLLIGVLLMPSVLLWAQQKTPPPRLALSLREAVRMALSPQGSQSIGMAGESERSAEARLRASRSAFLPDIETSFTGQNQVLNLAAMGFGGVNVPIPGFVFPRSSGSFTTMDARVHVRENLIDLASMRRIKAARAGIETAKTQTDEVRDQVALQVAKLYVAAMRSASAVKLAEAIVASAESTLDEVSNRNAQGQAVTLDVSHARVHLASEKQRLTQAQLERGQAHLALLNALNRDLETPLDLTESLALTSDERWSVAQAMEVALKSRSEIISQKKRIEAARLNDASIHSERLPSVVGYADAGTLGTNISNTIGTYDVGISLRIPVFDGGRREARRAEVQAYIRQEELRTSQLEKQVEFQVRQALLKLDLARGQVETWAAEVEVAQQELDHRRRRYEQGVARETELTEARVNLARAADGYAAALCAFDEGRIELMQSMGTIRSLAQ